MRSPSRISAAVFAALVLSVLVAPAGAADPTVTISGRAYAFNHMDTPLAGSTIKVRELPELSAITDANGDYTLEVPDDVNVTPYIDPPAGYNEIDLQTFHTRGKDIRNANFQTPGDAEYAGLAAILSVPIGAGGRPEQCAIVTTASDRNVRGVDFETFQERTPHGIPGATSAEFPALDGPTYFNEFVIPDVSKTETSEDGGIVWTEVPKGTYRIATTSPTTRFASFLATCKPGRIINANPPWGAYELADGERPLRAGVAAVTVIDPRVIGSAPRNLFMNFDVGERARVSVMLRRGENRLARGWTRVQPGRTKGRWQIRKGADAGVAALRVRIRDRAGNVVRSRYRVMVPPLAKPGS